MKRILLKALPLLIVLGIFLILFLTDVAAAA